jgi:uncharacterized phiE125 gp8 family phage protein
VGNRVLVTAPAEEPVSVAELVEHLNISADDVSDTNLTQYLSAVRRHIEEIAGVAFLTQTWELSQDLFPIVTDENPFSAIELPGAPLQSVTSVKYQDLTNTQQTASTSIYTVDTRSQPGRVCLGWDQTWPDALWVPNSIVIRYVCGYASIPAIPEDLRQTVLLAAGALNEYREEVIDGTVSNVGLLQRLLASYRVWA